MRVLYLTDRLSLRGGADQHLLQVIAGAARQGMAITVAHGRRDDDVLLPSGVEQVRVRGLEARVSSTARLGALADLLDAADVVHVQNVMNPVALERAVSTGRAIVTVQDHRVFCPGMGRTLPGGAPCGSVASDEVCAECLPDDAYRQSTLALTAARRAALQGAKLLVLSRYMAAELEAAGLPGAEVLPPWVEVGQGPVSAGRGFVLGGRLVPHKGIAVAHQAWSCAGAGHPLVVAGQGPLEGDLVGAELRGWLPSTELRALLRGARALLFPAFWQEPFGILGVEALSEGTPVVVANVGGTSEWSEAGCLVVAPGAVEELKEAMARLAGDSGLATRLGRQGREHVAARFSRPPIEGRLAEVYAEVRRSGVKGPPAEWMEEAATLRARRPRSYLFLCVANSARSQMAEGIARSLAPDGISVASAGSEPSQVRPEAVEALAEIGIDISGHRSKGVDELRHTPVDAVITLCADEVCPLWLGLAHRVHWGLDDPATVSGDGAARLDAFRATRDELRRRLGQLFAAS